MVWKSRNLINNRELVDSRMGGRSEQLASSISIETDELVRVVGSGPRVPSNSISFVLVFASLDKNEPPTERKWKIKSHLGNEKNPDLQKSPTVMPVRAK